jgi:hypothetical protein
MNKASLSVTMLKTEPSAKGGHSRLQRLEDDLDDFALVIFKTIPNRQAFHFILNKKPRVTKDVHALAFIRRDGVWFP